MTDLLTPREYLIDLGLAKPGRGRFSQAGKDALARAIEQGMVFKEREPSTTPATPRVPKAKPAEKVKPSGEADPKAVRAWAKENGHAVGDRGRIRPEVVNAYLEHCRGNDVKVVLPTETGGAKDFRPTATPIHPRVWFKVQDEGRETLVTYRTACNECGYSLYHCPAPRVFAADGETLVAAVPTDKPVVNDGKFW